MTTINSRTVELEGMKAAAYVAEALDKGASMDRLIKEFSNDARSVNGRVAFITYHKWVSCDIDGRWHLTNKGRSWVRKLLGVFCGMTSSLIIHSLEETMFLPNLI